MVSEIEKYKRAWKKFQNTVALLREKKTGILTRISKKLDEQRMEVLRKKLKEHV